MKAKQGRRTICLPAACLTVSSLALKPTTPSFFIINVYFLIVHLGFLNSTRLGFINLPLPPQPRFAFHHFTHPFLRTFQNPKEWQAAKSFDQSIPMIPLQPSTDGHRDPFQVMEPRQSVQLISNGNGADAEVFQCIRKPVDESIWEREAREMAADEFRGFRGMSKREEGIVHCVMDLAVVVDRDL